MNSSILNTPEVPCLSSLPEEGEISSPLVGRFQEVVNLVPEEKREEVEHTLRRWVATVEEYQGNLPHPQHATVYEDICPGSFDRLLAMRERELSYGIERDREERTHAYAWELGDQKNADSHAKIALVIGGCVAVGLIIGAVVCGIMGQPVLGGGLVATSAIGMVPAFINGRRERGVRRDLPHQQGLEPARVATAKSAAREKSASSKRRR